MEQPYQPPATDSMEPSSQVPPVMSGALVVRFAAYATIILSVGLIWLFSRYGEFAVLLSRIPDAKLPSGLRSAIQGMHVERAIYSVIVLALVAILLGLTRLTSAARALAFPAFAFVVALMVLALYLLAMAHS